MRGRSGRGSIAFGRDPIEGPVELIYGFDDWHAGHPLEDIEPAIQLLPEAEAFVADISDCSFDQGRTVLAVSARRMMVKNISSIELVGAPFF